MIKTTSTRENEETIFIQAIDQIYENYRKNSDFSEDEQFHDLNHGDIKINFDFIDFSDETLKNTTKKLRNTEGNLCNSSFSSESTEVESYLLTPNNSTNFQSEKKSEKIKDFLINKYGEKVKKNLDEEIKAQKEASKALIQEIIKSSNIKLGTFDYLGAKNYNFFNNSTSSHINNNNCSLNTNFNFNVNNNYNFPQHQINCNSYCGLAPRGNVAINISKFNMVYNSYQVGFYPQNLNSFEPSMIGINVNSRKNSYPNSNTHQQISNNFFVDNFAN